jgi:hypothetical protein
MRCCGEDIFSRNVLRSLRNWASRERSSGKRSPAAGRPSQASWAEDVWEGVRAAGTRPAPVPSESLIGRLSRSNAYRISAAAIEER